MGNVIVYCLLGIYGIYGLCLNSIYAAPAAADAATCEVTDITSTSATLHGKAYDYFSDPSTLVVWFQYGTTSSLYSGTSTTQSVNGNNVTSVSIGITGLSPNTAYYYRFVAKSSGGTEYMGREKSFITLSATATPTVTITPTPFSGRDCHSVSGRVTDVITGKGIKNATVIGGLGISSTDADGFYDWGDPEEILCCGNTYTLTASADGYVSLEQSIDVEPNIVGTLNFELQPISLTPTITATPSPSQTSECYAVSIKISPKRLILQRRQSSEVIVTLEGNNCVPEGEMITATIGKAGNKRIAISSASEVTDENGQAKFTITAKNKIGNAKITFKTGNLKRSIIVKVK